jgi:hypothetical protein
MGSGLSGGSVPLDCSIVLGVVTAQLQALVERQNLFYPPIRPIRRASGKARSAATSPKTRAARAA